MAQGSPLLQNGGGGFQQPQSLQKHLPPQPGQGGDFGADMTFGGDIAFGMQAQQVQKRSNCIRACRWHLFLSAKRTMDCARARSLSVTQQDQL